MSHDNHRDRAVEKLLPGVLTRTGMSPDECVDPETLAAWAERRLRPAEMAAVERHLAGCARCQTIAAVFARTEPAAAAPARRRALPWRWLLPVAGAAAAGLLIWMAVPRTTPPATSQSARVEAPTPPVVAPTASPPAQLPAAAPPAAIKGAPATGSRPKAPSSRALRSVGAPNAAPVEAPRAIEPLPAAPIPAPAAPSSPPPPQESAPPARMLLTEAPAAPPARAVGGLPTVVIEFVASTPAATADVDRIAPVAPRSGAAAGRGGGRASVPASAVTPPAPALLWRVFSDGHVERSRDRAATWERVAIEPPAFVTGGVAPYDAICWLIGRDGLVLLATDAVRFTRVNAPTTSNLVSIRAVDARQATVTTAGGRTYTTTDAGASWH